MGMAGAAHVELPQLQAMLFFMLCSVTLSTLWLFASALFFYSSNTV